MDIDRESDEALLEAIADAVGTPVYVYDADLLRSRIARLEAALADTPHQTCYSVKANDSLALLTIVAQAGLGADIVSGGELSKCLRAGIAPERIVFSGVGKTRVEISAALDAGVRSLQVESLGELSVIAEEARRLGLRAPVSMRVNPDVEAETHRHVSTGSAATKFGLAPDQVFIAQRQAVADPALEPVGLSFHVGSQLLDPTPVFTAAERVAEVWQKLAEEGIRLYDFDVGGGLGVPYAGGEEADVEGYAGSLARLAADLEATLILEPGRWLVAPAGTFLTRVLYVKEGTGRTIAVCDGGMNDLIRPALYDAYHPIRLLGHGSARLAGIVDVVGPVCETGDLFALERELPLPEPGDLLGIDYAGAYCRVMASTYNARPLCPEVLIEEDRWRLVRTRGSTDDLVAGEQG